MQTVILLRLSIVWIGYSLAPESGRIALTVLEDLRRYIGDLQIVDTHEHLRPEGEWVKTSHDVLTEYLAHYFTCDLVSAGLPQKTLQTAIFDSADPVKTKWHVLEPYWNAARNTGYARALDIAVRDLYGLPGIDASTIEELDHRFRAARAASAKGKSHYNYVLKDKSRIAVSLVDDLKGWDTSEDKRFFRYVYRIHHLLTVTDPVQLDTMTAATGVAIHGLSDWMDAAEKSIDAAVAKGAVALKCAMAYERSIYFPKTAYADAEAAFKRLYGIPYGSDVGPVNAGMGRIVENFMMHHVCRLADKRGFTFQIHTGIQEGNGNVLANSNPELLTNLFLEYKNIVFDVFHMSYPYEHVLSAIAKNFANVNIDMCWAHIISPEASVRALVEFLDAVPANKISAFGGDYIFVDGVYGHQYIARDNVAKALAMKVAGGCFDLDRAKEIAHWLFVCNPKRIFKLNP
jgi:hypothetical protein